MVVKAVTQRIARRDFLEPHVDVRLLFADAARPKPVDQHAIAVVRGSRLVNAFDPEAGRALCVRWPFCVHWLAREPAPLNTISVEVPCDRMRPLESMMRASADMIWRPRPITRPSARTRPVSCLMGRGKFALVSIEA